MNGSAFVQYPAVCLSDTRELLPIGEATVQDGTSIDQHGDPELMADFAAQYLAAHRAVMPTGRLPISVTEVMPALHLLVMAAELAMKADLIRSEKHPGKQHPLADLYGALENDHRQEAEDRFARCEPNVRLKSVGVALPTILEVLGIYDESYGGASSVYLDTRYYAEPTTLFRESSGLHRANLVKGNTPYPIFLPHVSASLIETFWFFDGAARLQRLGGNVVRGARASVDDNHGGWGLVPSSLGLVVLQVRQEARMGDGQAELPGFRRWKESRQPGFSTSWMCGGSELLFYWADESTSADPTMNIDGIDCRIWRDERLGMDSRDLYRLADALDAGQLTAL
ncbi:MAG: hypothetical protein OXH83_06400 [Bryobacterales bacterium]|nr:hypothetical protein [Bryobacterales bacterium]